MLPLLVLTPALYGCLPEQQQQVLKCEYEFLQTEPDSTLSGAAAPAFVGPAQPRHGMVSSGLKMTMVLSAILRSDTASRMPWRGA